MNTHTYAYSNPKRKQFRLFFTFSALMVLKMYLAWLIIFGEWATPIPLITGLPSVWVAFCLIELFSKKSKLLIYHVVDVVLTSVYFAVIMYYKYFGVIVTYEALRQVNQVVEVKGSVFDLMHPYFLFIYVDIVLIPFVYLVRKRRGRTRDKSHYRNVRRKVMASLFVMSLAVCFLFVWFNRGIENEIQQTKEMGVLNYEVYTIFADLNRKPLDPKLVTIPSVRHEKGLPETNAAANAFWAQAKNKNVIVIQLEAFQNFLLGLQVGGEEITPNLNRLLGSSYYFPHFFQQAGQGNTSDAEFLLNTSFYIPPNGAASQIYADKELPSMPKVFRENGYKALTFHTNDVIFWNRKELYAALGFDRYYDKQFFGDEDIVHFGASDEVLYDKTAKELARIADQGSKFYAFVISMSSHHPFDLPERKDTLKLPENYRNTFVGDYLRSQHYTDRALGQFFDHLKKNGLWDQSMIVIYGDHMGLPVYSLTGGEKKLMKDMLHVDYDYREMLNIPLIIRVPGEEPRVLPQIGGQVDLFPTIANLAGLSLDGHLVFGQDLMNGAPNLLPERYYLPSGSYINAEQIFIPGKSYKKGTKLMLGGGDQAQGSGSLQDYDRALKLLRMSDTYVEHLPDRD